MTVSRIAYLFEKYTNNECSHSEEQEFMTLLRQHENDEEVKTLLAGFIAASPSGTGLPNQAGKQILNSILGFVPEVEEVPVKQLNHSRRWMAIAAASIVVIFTGYILFNQAKEPARAALQTASVQQLVIKTGLAEGKVLHLSDGTTIWLSPSSSLEYPSAFSGLQRNVKLTGEALFDVARDAAHPFIIHTGTVQTKVLGTSFNIQAYEEQEDIAVMVLTGKVEVSSSRSGNVQLLPNQRALFNKKTDRFVKEEQKAAEEIPGMLKRKEGTFVYHNETLSKIANDIEIYYGIRVTLAESIRQCRVGASFDINDQPEKILEFIAISINATLGSGNNGFTLSGDQCPE